MRVLLSTHGSRAEVGPMGVLAVQFTAVGVLRGLMGVWR